jgi:hypothetical protein
VLLVADIVLVDDAGPHAVGLGHLQHTQAKTSLTQISFAPLPKHAINGHTESKKATYGICFSPSILFFLSAYK